MFMSEICFQATNLVIGSKINNLKYEIFLFLFDLRIRITKKGQLTRMQHNKRGHTVEGSHNKTDKTQSRVRSTMEHQIENVYFFTVFRVIVRWH